MTYDDTGARRIFGGGPGRGRDPSGMGRRPWGRPLAVLGVLALAGCSDGATPLPRPDGVVTMDAALPRCETAVPVHMDTVAMGLEVPWDMAFLPDGTALVTERPGRIVHVDPEAGAVPSLWAEVPVHAGDEVGLMGIDRQVLEDGTPRVVVSATRLRDEPSWAPGPLRGLLRRLIRAVDGERGHVVTLEILALPVEGDGGAGGLRTLVDGLPSGGIHGGGTVRVGPDGRLWLTSGDAGTPGKAQDPGTTRGKVLRFDADGGPSGVEPGSSVVARGVRHSQGMDWHPATGDLYLIDHGPTGMEAENGRTGNDELNRVETGFNLGWPWFAGLTRGDGAVSPLAEWTPAIAPAGMRFYRGGESAWDGSLFLTSLTTGSIRRIELGADGEARCEEVISPGLGRLRAVGSAPDGSVWVGTSNSDGRGSPRATGDVLVRLRPAPEGTGLAGPT